MITQVGGDGVCCTVVVLGILEGGAICSRGMCTEPTQPNAGRLHRTFDCEAVTDIPNLPVRFLCKCGAMEVQ
jgi:hypothetical protein